MSAPHLHDIMDFEEYLYQQLDELKQPSSTILNDGTDLTDEIIRRTLSKKFRKYSIGPEPLEHIEKSIKGNVEQNEPIKFTLPFGAYKLWRLDEAPEADWAELFSMMYFTKWLKPICEIYEPGVWFDFFSDDVIIPRMNNIPAEDVAAYKTSFEKVLEFIKPYQPENLRMTLSRVIDQYENNAEFEKDYEFELNKLKGSLDGGLPTLTEEDKAMTELNVKATPTQLADPKWREKVKLIHDSYTQVNGRRPYYRPADKRKIMVVTTPLWGMLCVGSTKDSTVKFWVGSGMLKPRETEFRQVILSPTQIDKSSYTKHKVKLEKLDGKNFKEIKVLDD